MEAEVTEGLDYVGSKQESTLCLYIGEGEYVGCSCLGDEKMKSEERNQKGGNFTTISR